MQQSDELERVRREWVAVIMRCAATLDGPVETAPNSDKVNPSLLAYEGRGVCERDKESIHFAS